VARNCAIKGENCAEKVGKAAKIRTDAIGSTSGWSQRRPSDAAETVHLDFWSWIFAKR
jgi:hypothetical protein